MLHLLCIFLAKHKEMRGGSRLLHIIEEDILMHRLFFCSVAIFMIRLCNKTNCVLPELESDAAFCSLMTQRLHLPRTQMARRARKIKTQSEICVFKLAAANRKRFSDTGGYFLLMLAWRLSGNRTTLFNFTWAMQHSVVKEPSD